MQLLSTLQTLKLVTLPVILMSESTLTMATPLAGVGRGHVVYANTVFFGLVFDVALKFTECPLLELAGVRDTLSDVFQVLERNRCTVVFIGFSDECF